MSKESGQINLLSPVLGGVVEPKVAGAALAVGKDKISNPIDGNAGVYVVVNKGVIVNKQDTGDIKQLQQQLQQQSANVFPQAFMRSLQNNADIKDYRIQVYDLAGH